MGIPDQGCWSAPPAWLSAPFSVESEPEERLTLKDTFGHINHVRLYTGLLFLAGVWLDTGCFPAVLGAEPGPGALGGGAGFGRWGRRRALERWGRSRAPGAGGGAGFGRWGRSRVRALGAEPGPGALGEERGSGAGGGAGFGRWGRSRAPGAGGGAGPWGTGGGAGPRGAGALRVRVNKEQPGYPRPRLGLLVSPSFCRTQCSPPPAAPAGLSPVGW